MTNSIVNITCTIKDINFLRHSVFLFEERRENKIMHPVKLYSCSGIVEIRSMKMRVIQLGRGITRGCIRAMPLY